MKPIVDKDLCIGCSTCTVVCPNVFKMVKSDSGEDKAEVNDGVDYDALKAQIADAIASCPTSAIMEK